MERLTYILDTSVVADYINDVATTTVRVKQAIRDEHLLILCPPVKFEVMRGLLKVGQYANKKFSSKCLCHCLFGRR